MPLRKRHFSQFSKSAIGIVLIGTILLIDAMAACPALHKLIHPDAGKPGHHCAVTVFKHGKIESATVEIPLPVAEGRIEAPPQIVISYFCATIEHLPPGRAPPAFSAVS